MIIVGDLHGRIKTLEKIISLRHQMLFLGDFLDSFTESSENQIEVVKTVLDLQEKGKAEFLLGNHELSYINSRVWRCSGWNDRTSRMMMQYKDELWERGLSYVILGANIIVTHAGITLPLWNMLTESRVENNLQEKIDMVCRRIDGARSEPYSWLYQAGTRGNGMHTPGPFWCDWKDEFEPVPEIVQVVGHTAVLGPAKHFQQEFIEGLRRSPNGDWCIDCLDLQTASSVLLYEDGKLTPLPI